MGKLESSQICKQISQHIDFFKPDTKAIAFTCQ